jgi:uncharacterized Zn-finger protein
MWPQEEEDEEREEECVKEEEKEHSCSICGKSFARLALLLVHEKSHTDEKPFRCDTCPKAFLRRSGSVLLLFLPVFF